MWPVPFLTEGLVIGVLVAWLRWRCPWRAHWRVLALVVVATLLLGCASKARPKPEKAMRWMGACQVCQVET